MKIALATIQTPFIHGGAEYLIHGLLLSLRNAGHLVERVSMPFRFGPDEQVSRSIEVWQSEDFTLLNGHQADQVICLQFPTYYLKHPVKAFWLLHQYRAVYDLWETPFTAEFRKSFGAQSLRQRIIEADTKSLGECWPRFTIAANVSKRLQSYNNITSHPIYHPPYLANQFYSADAEAYVFAPSRLEEAKRQELLIRAMMYVQSPLVAIIAGEGGQDSRLRQLTHELKLENRIKFVGHVSDQEKMALYAHCLCVFFAPFDEDYGYVTLEAMLAAKPLVTCRDSGGPLEFVVHNETGFIVAPDPREIANAFDLCSVNGKKAREMGGEAAKRYEEMDISWDNVVEKLTSPRPVDWKA